VQELQEGDFAWSALDCMWYGSMCQPGQGFKLLQLRSHLNLSLNRFGRCSHLL